MNDLAITPADVAREIPPIDPLSVTIESAGLNWRHLAVTAPKAFILDDLREPSIWLKVQSSTKSLRFLDTVTVVAWDRSWIADARVARADAKSAVLSTPAVTRIPQRFDPLPDSELYRVEWTGAGYAVARKADGHRMTTITPSLAAATRDMDALYGRR